MVIVELFLLQNQSSVKGWNVPKACESLLLGSDVIHVQTMTLPDGSIKKFLRWNAMFSFL